MSITNIHPDAEALADHLCSYASACVADAVIEYLSRLDCSPVCRDIIREYLQQPDPQPNNMNDPYPQQDSLAFVFVYSPRNVDDRVYDVKCLTAPEAKKWEAQMLKDGWEHTATLNTCAYIEYLANKSENPASDIAELI